MEKTPRIVPVSTEEAPLIYAANEIEARLYAEARDRGAEASKTAGRPLQDPLLMYNTQQEAEILRGRDNLVRKYRETLNLETDPILVLPVPSQKVPSLERFGGDGGHFHRYCRKSGGSLSQMTLVDLFLERVPVCRRDGVLFVWADNHFRRASDTMMRGLIGEVLREELMDSNASAMISSILSILQADRRIYVDSRLKTSEIAMENGTLDFLSMRFQTTTPQKFNSFFLEAYWTEEGFCPTFDAFLWSISGGDAILSQRIFETIGFLLSPGNEAKKFVLFRGISNSGKSVLGNLIRSFFPPEDVAGLPLHQFGERFSMGALADHHLNLSMDLPSGVIDGKAAATIKLITGDDLVFVESKGEGGLCEAYPMQAALWNQPHD